MGQNWAELKVTFGHQKENAAQGIAIIMRVISATKGNSSTFSFTALRVMVCTGFQSKVARARTVKTKRHLCIRTCTSGLNAEYLFGHYLNAFSNKAFIYLKKC